MGTNFADFHQAAMWVMSHGYFFIFLVMCVEGPITTAAAGFAAALGIFNPWVILIISILGDLVPDSLYYSFGYISRFAILEKISNHIGLTHERIKNLENKLKEHFGKTMIALKLTPLISTLGFMVVGYLRLSFLEFTGYSASITIPKSIVFLLLGYFFGQLYNINQYLHYAEIFFPIAIVMGILALLAYKKISAIVAKKVEKI
jgi:membrane protein DedA with SNARE-associated domain